MQNKYSEGYVGARYYGGNEYIDLAEAACQARAFKSASTTTEKAKASKTLNFSILYSPGMKTIKF